MPEQVQIDLSKYRLAQSADTIEEAQLMYDAGKFKGCNNRSYYAIFYATQAVLALDGVDFKRHSGVIGYFQEQFIKTKIFEVEYSKILTQASLIRNASDYNAFYLAKKDEALTQLNNAKKFYVRMHEYLNTVWKTR